MRIVFRMKSLNKLTVCQIVIVTVASSMLLTLKNKKMPNDVCTEKYKYDFSVDALGHITAGLIRQTLL